MDGHVDRVGPLAVADEYDLAAVRNQGELFADGRPSHLDIESGGLPTLQCDTLCVPTLQSAADSSQTLSQHDDGTASQSQKFISQVSSDAANRSRFFDSCLTAQEGERLKLGRELHDSTGQLLLALRLEIAHLRQIRGVTAEESLLDEIEETVREIDREIRAFAYTHYPAEIGRDGLGPALASLARGFASRTGLRIRFHSIPDPIARTGEVALALLRVAQEALLNVHRHAQAVHVDVALTLRYDDMLELTVKDDGIGIKSDHALEESHGVGLQGMRHRVERLGGRFAIRRLKRGTKIIAALPA